LSQGNGFNHGGTVNNERFLDFSKDIILEKIIAGRFVLLWLHVEFLSVQTPFTKFKKTPQKFLVSFQNRIFFRNNNAL
jgi:hypothetical protein